MSRIVLILSIVGFSLSACSKNLVPFTETLKDEYRWDEKDMKRIQFYTSDDIVLQRKLESDDVRIQSGRIRVVDGREVEEVIIRKGTPGVAVRFPDSERVGVSFELANHYFLTFGVNPKKGNRFYLMAQEWKNRVGKVTYNDDTYFTSPSASAAFLMVDIKRWKDWDVDSRVARGRTVD